MGGYSKFKMGTTKWKETIQIRLQLAVMLAPVRKFRYPRLPHPAGRSCCCVMPTSRPRTRHRAPLRESSCCGQAGIGGLSKPHISTCHLDTVRHRKRAKVAVADGMALSTMIPPVLMKNAFFIQQLLFSY